MNFKKYFTILSLFLLLMLCVSAISAADDNINATVATPDDNQDSISIGDEETISSSDSDGLSGSQDESVIQQTDNDEISVDGIPGTVSPYQKFCDDLENGVTNITLIGSFKISSSFRINYDVVIDGNGYTIDAQHKTNIFDSRASLTLKNLVLINGKADKGGAVFSYYSNLVVDKCTFKDNYANKQGGAIASTHGDLTVTNSKFEKNTVSTASSNIGGAIWILDSKSQISKSSFTSSKAYNGGAIYANCALAVDGCTFTSNSAKKQGGAIASLHGSLTVTDSKFNKNTVPTSSSNIGGAIWSYDSDTKISKSSFTSSKAGKGGAIYANSKMTLDGCTFTSNYAGSQGGAVVCREYSLTIKDSKFSKNTVSTSGSNAGGAVWIYKSKTTISKSSFSGSKAAKGGAIYANAKMTVDDCTFTSNYATKQGGAILSLHGSLTVKNSNFNKDKVSTSKSNAGGAIWAFKSKTSISNTPFTNCKASDGGAVYCNGKISISGCTFTNNFAKRYGGAVGCTHGSLTVKGSTFKKNSVKNSGSTGLGGAVWIFSSSSQISKSTFSYNTCISKSLKKHSKATKYKFNGGAIEYGKGSKHVLSDCKFTGNKATNHGGSIFVVKTKSLKIKRSTFTKNRVYYEDGGAISFAGSKLSVSDSEFKNNLAREDGGAIDSYSVNGKKVRVSVKNSKFISNTAYKGAGAIWMGIKTSYTLERNTFTKNKASLGGAVVAEAGSSKIVKCVFKSNKAGKITSWTVKTKFGGKLNHCGGAVYIEKAKCKITKSTFKKNKASYGGAVHFNAGKLTFTKNKLSGNKASKKGNKVYKKK